MRPRLPTVFVMEASAKASLPVIESMARAGLRVAAGSHNRINAGFFSRHCHERWVYPSPRDDRKGFHEWLLDFLARRPIEVFFPLGHYGALAVAEIQDQIRRHTRLLMPDLPTFLRGYEKIPTLKAAEAAGVPIPETWYPEDHAEGVEAILPQIRSWPVLVKPSVGAGARGIVWCHTPAELRQGFADIRQRHGPSFVQDFVPPGGMQYKVDFLVDGQQRKLAGVVYGKTRMYPPKGGSSVLNYSAHRPDILELAHQMLRHLQWVGFCDFDFVVDPRDDGPKLMEINPRLPESFNMGPSVGVDFARMIYHLARGEPVEPVLEYPANHYLRFLVGDVLWFLRVSNRERFSTHPNWFKFFGRDMSYQLCRATDPGPLLGFVLENFLLLFDRRSRAERLRLSSATRPAQAADGDKAAGSPSTPPAATDPSGH
ncbi:MAG: ATP-grasp domain-containing protein [Verrucomicrobiales bacterium]|nr:ATP-grasp domain-containing protein [Verrucomicrobiales bacterium]